MAGGGGGAEEINLVPYLDIMVNLIMFMITVTAYLVEMKEAPVLPPAYGDNAGGGGEQKAFASVNVTKTAVIVLDSQERFTATLEKENGQYPMAKLNATLRQYRDAFEVGDNVVIAADPAVPYSAVVEAMDAARSDKKGTIFPGVTLALALQQ